MEEIKQTGIITNIEDDTLSIKITTCSACSQCSAKSFCSISEQKDKIITAKVTNSSLYSINDYVDVSINQPLAIKAVLYSYVLPLILLLATIIALYTMGFNDFISGISGIIVLIPYYFGLFLLRNKFRADFKFIVSAPRTTQGRN
jgi:sigma-E factor negative regulatory protein RseC